jgi:four helix bundle protein
MDYIKSPLDQRTLAFARRVRSFVRGLPRSIANTEDIKQLIRASGSVGANYIEANESFSKKDFALRLKISRKEAKEAAYWLELIDVGDSSEKREEKIALIQEATELLKIFSSILKKMTI